MPINSDGTFSRVWKFVDHRAAGDPVTRADLDIAFDDLVEGLRGCLGDGGLIDLTNEQITQLIRTYLYEVCEFEQALEQAEEFRDQSRISANRAEDAEKDADLAKAAAQAARDAAIVGVSGIFADPVYALANTTLGDRFILAGSDGWALYEHTETGESKLSGDFPSLDTLNDMLRENIRIQSVSEARPGELLARYSTSRTGDRSVGDEPVAAIVSADPPYGKAIDVGPARIVALRDRIALDGATKINVRAVFKVQNNTCDPEGEKVKFGIEWLDSSYASVGNYAVFDKVIWESDGWQNIERIINTTGVDQLYGYGINEPFDPNADNEAWADEGSIYECIGVDPGAPPAPDPGPYPNPFIVPPAGASYAVPYIETHGTDGVTRIALLDAYAEAGSMGANRLTYPLGFVFPEDVIPGNRIRRTIFVRQDGDDTKTGRSLREAVRSIERARDLAAEDDCVPYSIQVWPGDYETQGHIDIPDNVSEVTGISGQRSVRIMPAAGYESRNVFRGGDGFMLRNVSGMGWQVDNFDDPTEGFLVAFRPGATIYRALYVDHCVSYRAQKPEFIPSPVDPDNGNPLIPKGPGIALADSSVVSPYSPFPQIMIEASTTSAPNGVGYVAKGDGFINALNTVSIWPHKHFMALNGGELLLNNCASQFGDYTLWSEGHSFRVRPPDTAGPLIVDAAASAAVESARASIVSAMWSAVVAAGYGGVSQELSERDAGGLVSALSFDLGQGSQESTEFFIKGLFPRGEFVSPSVDAFVAGFEGIRTAINGLSMSGDAKAMASGLIDVVISSVQTPDKLPKPSKISAAAQQWNFPWAGVNRRAFTRPQREVIDTIIELDLGIVLYSGIDNLGKQYFTGGALVNPLTGMFEGPPVDRTISPRARRAAIIAGGQM